MKNLKSINEWFGKSNKYEVGDDIVRRILDIVKKENIKIVHSGGYSIYIDDNIYSFSYYYGNGYVSKYDKSQEKNDTKYGKVILGEPKSRYEFSKKMWKELEKAYNIQQTNIKTDLDELDDTHRTSKKYNL